MNEPPPKRFVILYHTGHGRAHWDLMLEQEDALATWKVYHDLLASPSSEVDLFRIDDHRMRYLEYEGPVSGGRGEVRRICHGSYERLNHSPTSWHLRLTSPAWVRIAFLEQVQGPRWRLTWAS